MLFNNNTYWYTAFFTCNQFVYDEVQAACKDTSTGTVSSSSSRLEFFKKLSPGGVTDTRPTRNAPPIIDVSRRRSGLWRARLSVLVEAPEGVQGTTPKTVTAVPGTYLFIQRTA